MGYLLFSEPLELSAVPALRSSALPALISAGAKSWRRDLAPKCRSPTDGVIENQHNHGADNRYEETVEVDSAYAMGSKDAEQPATAKSADNTQQDVEQHALTSPIHKLAADEPCNQAENDPSHE